MKKQIHYLLLLCVLLAVVTPVVCSTGNPRIGCFACNPQTKLKKACHHRLLQNYKTRYEQTCNELAAVQVTLAKKETALAHAHAANRQLQQDHKALKTRSDDYKAAAISKAYSHERRYKMWEMYHQQQTTAMQKERESWQTAKDALAEAIEKESESLQRANDAFADERAAMKELHKTQNGFLEQSRLQLKKFMSQLAKLQNQTLIISELATEKNDSAVVAACNTLNTYAQGIHVVENDCAEEYQKKKPTPPVPRVAEAILADSYLEYS